MRKLRERLLLLLAFSQLAIHLRQPVPRDRIFRVQRDRLLQMLLRQCRLACRSPASPPVPRAPLRKTDNSLPPARNICGHRLRRPACGYLAQFVCGIRVRGIYLQVPRGTPPPPASHPPRLTSLPPSPTASCPIRKCTLGRAGILLQHRFIVANGGVRVALALVRLSSAIAPIPNAAPLERASGAVRNAAVPKTLPE